MIKLLAVLFFVLEVSRASGPCCSVHYAGSAFCVTTDQGCCEAAGGFFVQGHENCSGQTDSFGVDLRCVEWNEQNGTTGTPVCCEYDPTGQSGVRCTSAEACAPLPEHPKLRVSEGGCNLCPEFPPPEAHCRCQDQCCESATTSGAVIFIGLVVGLSALALGGCCAFLFIAERERRRSEKED